MRAGSPSGAGASGPAADGASVDARDSNARFFAQQARSKLLEALDFDQAASTPGSMARQHGKEYSSDSEGDGPPRTTIRSPGRQAWDEFIAASGLRDLSGNLMFDMHGVIDRFTFDEAIDVGLTVDYCNHINAVMCSYSQRGSPHRREAFNPGNQFYPMVNEMDAIIFTSQRCGRNSCVEVYREQWMPLKAICVDGDKGQAAELIGMPCLLLDDRQENIDRLWDRSSDDIVLHGKLVDMRRGSRRLRADYITSTQQIIDLAHRYDRECRERERLWERGTLSSLHELARARAVP